MVLDLVTELLRRPGPPPVILLQGDHGTAMLRYHSAFSARRISVGQARERLGAFGAYYLPGGGERVLGVTLTLVNLFPKILNHYLGARLPMAPDDLFVSLLDTPVDFAEVDPARRCQLGRSSRHSISAANAATISRAAESESWHLRTRGSTRSTGARSRSGRARIRTDLSRPRPRALGGLRRLGR